MSRDSINVARPPWPLKSAAAHAFVGPVTARSVGFESRTWMPVSQHRELVTRHKDRAPERVTPVRPYPVASELARGSADLRRESWDQVLCSVGHGVATLEGASEEGEMLITGRVGEQIVVDGRSVDDLPRKGEIVEVLSSNGVVHYRVRWDNGTDCIFFPGSDAHFVGFDTPSNKS